MYRSSAAEDRSLLIVAFSGQVFALDRATGARRWEQKVGSASTVELHVEGGVVIAATSSCLAFLDYLTGVPHRLVDLRPAGRPTLLVDGGHLYLGASGEVTCFTLRGDQVWSDGFSGRGLGAVALGVPGSVRQGDADT